MRRILASFILHVFFCLPAMGEGPGAGAGEGVGGSVVTLSKTKIAVSTRNSK